MQLLLRRLRSLLIAVAQRLPEPLVRFVYERTLGRPRSLEAPGRASKLCLVPTAGLRRSGAPRPTGAPREKLAEKGGRGSTDERRLSGDQRRIHVLEQKLAEAQGQAKARELLLRRIPRFEYGSFTPGVPGWSERWREGGNRRVLMFAPKDYSGSLLKWAEAVNGYSEYAARVVTLQSSQYAHNLDLVLPQPGLIEAQFDRLLDEADVVHVKDECFFSDELGRLPARYRPFFDNLREKIVGTGKPVVFTHYGGWSRSLRHDRGYRDAVMSCAARVTMTPDLAYDWFEGAYIPHLIDTERFPYAWTDVRRVAHSPTTRERKGTEEFLEAMRDLPVEVEIIEGVPHAECLERKRSAGLFFDQAGAESDPRLGVTDVVGWYGNSALEAAVHGIPTIAHLSEAAFEGARRCGKDIEGLCAILNTPRDPHGIREVIGGFFESSEAERRSTSERTHEWIKTFHGYPGAGRELGEVYDQVLAGRPRAVSHV